MIRHYVARFTLLVLVAAACDQSREPASVEANDASNTLEQARTKAADLANSSQNYQPVRFVSDIEQVARPVTKPKPSEVVKKGPDPVEVEQIPAPAEVTTESPLPDVAPDSSTEVASAPRVPSIIPRDAPLPDAVGSGSGSGVRRGTDPGPDVGEAIGVVLRGGRVDPGHCPRHRPPTNIPNRFPR